MPRTLILGRIKKIYAIDFTPLRSQTVGEVAFLKYKLEHIHRTIGKAKDQKIILINIFKGNNVSSIKEA